jgi:hypothetical protein
MPVELINGPEEPTELSYLWDWYAEIFTGEPLQWQDICYWAQATETPIKGWESKAIKAIDQEYWASRR